MISHQTCWNLLELRAHVRWFGRLITETSLPALADLLWGWGGVGFTSARELLEVGRSTRRPLPQQKPRLLSHGRGGKPKSLIVIDTHALN